MEKAAELEPWFGIEQVWTADDLKLVFETDFFTSSLVNVTQYSINSIFMNVETSFIRVFMINVQPVFSRNTPCLTPTTKKFTAGPDTGSQALRVLTIAVLELTESRGGKWLRLITEPAFMLVL